MTTDEHTSKEIAELNASLDAPGGDNVVERVRALADQFGQVCEAVKTEDAAHVVDEVRALVESEARSNADHNALLTHLQRIRTALRIEIDEPWEIVVDRVIGCVNIAASKPLDQPIVAAPPEHHRPGHARVAVMIWPSRADRPDVDRPEYAIYVDMGADPIAEFLARAQRETAHMLATWGQPKNPDPGRFTADLAAQMEERDAKLASGLAPESIAAGAVDAKIGGLLPPLAKLPRPSALLASEQILREVITAALASGPSPADVFEILHRPASAETPSRTELHVFAGKGPTTATTQVLAYVELGTLWVISLQGREYVRSHDLVDHRWTERIRAALDRK